MDMNTLYLRAADAVVVIHAAYAGFVVFGFVAILLGIALGWKWVRNFWFRMVHFLMIAIVAAEAMGGALCPLTTWENQLREKGGAEVREGTFIGRISQAVLFVGDENAIRIGHCAFGALVLSTLVLAPPRRPARPRWLAGPHTRPG
jgi:hypothetical protein